MNRKKPKPKCNCDFCAALDRQVNKEMLYPEGGFYFPFQLNTLEWRTQVAIGRVRELYHMPVNGGTAFLVESEKADYITTASADRITAITGDAWVYITCQNS